MTKINQYLSKLKQKNILIIPISEYTASNKNMLHKCICGNEWYTTPNRVLAGARCGCGRKNSKGSRKPSKELIEKRGLIYLQTLSNKNIKVKPLEKYIDSKTKILHKCICNREWMVTPNRVLAGVKCGCDRSNNNRSRYINRKTILYYVSINNMYKIGVRIYNENMNIEDNVIKGRYCQDRKKHNIKLIYSKLFQDGSIAWDIEKTILKKYKKLRNLNEKILISGNTELFNKDISQEIKDYFK